MIVWWPVPYSSQMILLWGLHIVYSQPCPGYWPRFWRHIDSHQRYPSAYIDLDLDLDRPGSLSVCQVHRSLHSLCCAQSKNGRVRRKQEKGAGVKVNWYSNKELCEKNSGKSNRSGLPVRGFHRKQYMKQTNATKYDDNIFDGSLGPNSETA